MFGGDFLESQSVSTMPSDSEVIITDEFDGTARTVRHKVIAPVATARQLLKKKTACQNVSRTVLHVLILGITFFVLILLCICLETWWSAKNSDLMFQPHTSEDAAYHHGLVNYVNDPRNNATWKAKYNRFASKGMEEEEEKNDPNDKSKEKDNEVLRMFEESKDSVFGDTLDYLSELIKRDDIVLPETFDARIRWPLCASISRIQNQGVLWIAVSATSVISDRICIQSNMSMQPQISSRDLLSCCSHCGTCGGATWPLFSFTYWKSHGIVTGGGFGSFEGCKPYDKSGSCGSPCSSDLYIQRDSDKICERKCQSIYGRRYEDDLIRGRRAYWIKLLTRTFKPIPNAEEYFPDFMKQVHALVKNVSYEILIKRELLLRGPVMACYPVFDDFLHYSSGIYNKTAPNTRMLYGHCARLIGWGSENGIGFWQYANSWSHDWGENGFFRVQIDNIPEEVASALY
ncbi:Pept-C1 domain-containing protein [Aphelenchoides besseyi]|nr:Pept-C1 domain-containing protein [Aphelenchoides besseyi]